MKRPRRIHISLDIVTNWPLDDFAIRTWWQSLLDQTLRSTGHAAFVVRAHPTELPRLNPKQPRRRRHSAKPREDSGDE